MEFKETTFAKEEMNINSVQEVKSNYQDYGMEGIIHNKKTIIYLNRNFNELIVSSLLDKCLDIPVIAKFGGYAQGQENNYYHLNHVFEDKINFNEDLLKNYTLLDKLFRDSSSFVIVKFDEKNGIIYYQEIVKIQTLFLLESKTKEKRAEIQEDQKNRNLNNSINIFSKLSEEEQKELLVKLLLNKNEGSK